MKICLTLNLLKSSVKVIAKKTAENKMAMSALRTQLKKFDAAVAANDNVEAMYVSTVKKVDEAASKGLIHKNKANRTKAQLAKKAQA